MTKTNISKTHKAKAAQSPEAVALPDDVTRVNITHRAKKKLIISASGTWADFFAGPRFDDDFLCKRDQPITPEASAPGLTENVKKAGPGRGRGMTEHRKEYFDQLLTVGRSMFKKRQQRELKLAILKAENSNTKLYKYCGIDSALKILDSNSLLLQAPDNFNDPFDCLANVGVWDSETRFAPSPKDIEFVRNKLNELPAKYKPDEFKLSHDLRAAYSYVITCFCVQSDNHLMWSHYANNHRGVCLEYDIADMIDDIHPCFYTGELDQFIWGADSKVLALVKNDAWKYENEWRFVRGTIRPKMRLLGQVLHTIYNSVHANPNFRQADYEEWSSINAAIISEMETTYESERKLQIRPTKLILGSGPINLVADQFAIWFTASGQGGSDERHVFVEQGPDGTDIATFSAFTWHSPRR